MCIRDRYGTSESYFEVFFDSDPAANVTLAKDTDYRMVVASTSSKNISFNDLSVPEAAAMEVMAVSYTHLTLPTIYSV